MMTYELKQYTDLFEQCRAIIDANAPHPLNKRRLNALERLKALMAAPCGDSDLARCKTVNAIFAPDYGVNINRLDFGMPPSSSPCDRLVGRRPAAMVVNDTFLTGGAPLPEGVELCSLAEAARKYPDLFDDEIAPSDHPVVALNDMLVQDGVFLRVSRGVTLSRPIQVLSVFNSSRPIMGLRRVRVIIEEGASASVLMCEHPVEGASDHLSCRVVEASVAAGATLSFHDLEEAGSSGRRASVFASRQEADSTLSVTSIFLNGGTTRNEFFPFHHGENCSTRLGGLVIGGGTQTIENAVTLTHAYPRCSSAQLFKYALFDSSRGSFEGLVKVAEGAVHTDARQTNRNLLASPDATMYAMPQLEIYCDEVKASHGSATGRLDDNALFYLRSRGIPEQEARMMLINAFMTDVLDEIGDETLRERLRHLVDVRLRGVEEVCTGCKAN